MPSYLYMNLKVYCIITYVGLLYEPHWDAPEIQILSSQIRYKCCILYTSDAADE